MPQPTNLSTTDGVDLSFRQLLGSWRLMAAVAPKPSALSAPGFECIFAGVPVPFFNVALITDPRVSSAALTAHGRQACDFAADKDVPWLFIVTHETLDAGVDPAAALDGCGLAPAMRLTGMVASHLTPAARAAEGLQLVIPQDDALCAAAIDINSAAYAMDLAAAKPLMGPSFWADHYLAVGLAAGVPVCSAAVLMVEGFRYVVLVATLPDQQRRGFAEAAMRHALQAAVDVHGETPTVLHATEAGRPLYERMGYATISRHTVFMEKRFLGH